MTEIRVVSVETNFNTSYRDIVVVAENNSVVKSKC